MNETVGGGIDMLNSINTALQKVSAKPIVWMPAWSDERETMLVSVERADRLGNSTLSVDCSDEEFRSIEASFNQVLRRTTVNKPLRTAQRTKGQKGFEAWHAIVRRCDLRIMSEKNSAYAALISIIAERDRAKDVEQFDEVLRTFINETNKAENRFGTNRDEEYTLAVKKLLLESLLNYRFRDTMMSHSELLVALESIFIDQVASVPTARNRKIDTSAPMDVGMAELKNVTKQVCGSER